MYDNDNSYYILKSIDVEVNRTLVMTPDGEQEFEIQEQDVDVNKTVVFTEESQINFVNELKSLILKYLNERNPNTPLVNIVNEIADTLPNHIMVSNIRNSFITLSQYQNVLYIPSFKDSRHDSYWYTQDPFIQTSNIETHLTPVINKKFESSPNIYVAYPDSHVSLYKYIMEEYGVNIISSNKMYTLGDDDYSITLPEGVVFDAVWIAGVDNLSDGYFAAGDVKQDFAQYCTEDFDLIDDFVDDEKKMEYYTQGINISFVNENRMVGETKNTSEISSYIAAHFAPKNLLESHIHHERNAKILTRVIDEGLQVY